MIPSTQEYSWEASTPAAIVAGAAFGTEDYGEYATVVTQYHRRLYAIAWRILRNHDEVEEAVQQAHLRALSHLHQFSGRAALSAWLIQIVINEAFTRLRRKRPSTDLDSLQLRSMTGDPEQEAVRAQLGNMIFAALRALPVEQQTVFVLREVWELDTAETAERLGVTQECVKTRLHRAKTVLRRRLGPRFRRNELVRG
jgi:RNA polymerase sigma-70 factor (ECF subfamily)